MEDRRAVHDELKIRISGLSSGIHEYHFSAQPSSVGLGDNFRDPIEIDARLDKTERQLYLKTDVRTSGHFQCDRCLDEFEQPLAAAYTMVYDYDASQPRTYTEEEFRVISVDTPTIDMAEDVRETIVLSVPLKLLCGESCKGLCPHCGINRNTGTCGCAEELHDPSFQGLKDLLNK